MKKIIKGRKMTDKPYDIQQRTFRFAINIINLSHQLPHSQVGKILCGQLVRAGTSVGANIEEATSAFSKPDFIYKANISLSEARETNYWLRIIKESGMIKTSQLNEMLLESEELMKILGAIISKARGKRKT